MDDTHHGNQEWHLDLDFLRFIQGTQHFQVILVILQRSHSNPCSANMNLPTTSRSHEFFYRHRWRTQSFCGKFACLIHAVLKLGAELKESNHILLMVQKSGVHQLRLVVYLPLFAVLYIPGGCWGFLNHQQYHPSKWFFPVELWWRIWHLWRNGMYIPSSNAVKIVKISTGYWTSFTDADLTAVLPLGSWSAR